MINCEVSLTLTWSTNCVLTDIIAAAADATVDSPVVAINTPTGPTFAVTDCKLYAPVVTLSAENDNNKNRILKNYYME